MSDLGDVRLQHAQAARAFDMIAADYDVAYGVGGNRAMVWMRAENLALLRSVFHPRSRLLEIGCGTGDEAVALAAEGHAVLATDISSTMAAITAQKAFDAGVADRVRALALPAGSLSALRPRYPFDGAYASFGGLNCEPVLQRVADALTRLIRPGGVFVCGVMGRTYLFELLWYAMRGRPRKALRRVGGGWIPAPVAGAAAREAVVMTRYIGRRELKRVFDQGFRAEFTLALPLLMPPPYAAALYDRYPRLIAHLECWDRAAHRRWPLHSLGDHVVVVFRRR